MKAQFIILLAVCLPLALPAADQLNPELQRGLFEEEANQNFDAAIKAYQSVLTTHDSERKLAATALFRLGECYRKLGKTNDAITQYQRLVADFPDQAALANLSRQNLIGLGAPKAVDAGQGGTGERARFLEQALAGLQLEAAQAASVLKPLQAANPTQRRSIAPTLVPDTVLNRLLEELSVAEQKVASLKVSFTAEHPNVRAALDVVQVLNRQIDERVDGIVEGLKLKAEALAQQTAELKKELAELTRSDRTNGERATASPTADPAARAQLKELLQKEISIATQFASEQRKKVEVGTLAKGEEVRFERDVLNLKRQLIAADGLASAKDRQEWRELLLQEIQLAEDAARLEKQKLENGKTVASEVARLQRDVLILKRELVAFDAVPASASKPVEVSATAAPSPEAEELARAERTLAQLQGWDLSQLRRLIPTLAPDAELERMEKDLSVTLENLRSLESGGINTEDKARQRDELRVRIAEQTDRLSQRAEEIVMRLEKRAANLRERVARQPVQTASTPNRPATSASAAPTDEEEKEIRRIQSLIKDSPDLINAAGEGGLTPLHLAAVKGQLVVAHFLLANKANVNARHSRSVTPLHEAVRNGHKSMAELLLANGADVNAGQPGNDTPLHYAAQRGYRSIVEALLASKADVNARSSRDYTPLHSAVDQGFTFIADALLDAGADVNAIGRIKESNAAQFPHDVGTPLHLAAYDGNLAITKLIVARRPDVNLRNQFGETPLFLAVNQPEVVRTLIEAGADVNKAIDVNGRDFGKTPLCTAVVNNRPDTVALLLQAGANPNVQFGDPDSPSSLDTPLSSALNRTNPDERIIRALLEKKADPNAKTGSGYTPLHLAVAYKSTNAVESLLQHGANIEIENREGDTPLTLAVNRSIQEMVALLLKHKANPNVTLRSGQTLLNVAVRLGNGDVVDHLLAAGADPNAVDGQGLSALDYLKGAGTTPSGPGVVSFAAPTPVIGSVPVAGNPRTQSTPNQLADRLRQAGARDWAPRPGQITMTRRSSGTASAVFTKGTNDWNRYSLFEAMAFTYFGSGSSFPFPDFSKITITRLDPASGKIVELQVDLPARLATESCKADFWLEWGDLIDIPEGEHKLDEKWNGSPALNLQAIANCLDRKVTIIVKGTAKETRFSGLTQWRAQSGAFARNYYFPATTYRLKETLLGSGLLLTSSDLTRVKVKRADPTTTRTRERSFDLSIAPSDDLWLRDGDVIEVPEK